MSQLKGRGSLHATLLEKHFFENDGVVIMVYIGVRFLCKRNRVGQKKIGGID